MSEDIPNLTQSDEYFTDDNTFHGQDYSNQQAIAINNEIIKEGSCWSYKKVQNKHIKLLDVFLVFVPKYEKDLVRDMQAIITENNEIDLADLVNAIKELGFPIKNTVISYYSHASQAYIYCGNDPLSDDCVISAREIRLTDDDRSQITLRIRQPNNTHGDGIAKSGNNALKEDNDEVTFRSDPIRKKERKIGHILQKVYQWRRDYMGYIDPHTGQKTRMSLKESAEKVGISKKSLDDYLLQIKFGKKYGFDFTKHLNDRVGVLRTFVKKHKKMIKKQKYIEQESNENETKMVEDPIKQTPPKYCYNDIKVIDLEDNDTKAIIEDKTSILELQYAAYLIVVVVFLNESDFNAKFDF